MAQAPRPRVQADSDLVQPQPQGARRHRVEDLVDVLDLGEVVARAQGAQLTGAALEGTIGHQPGLGALQPAALLQELEIAGGAQPPLHRPGRALAEDGRQLSLAEAQITPPLADAGRDVGEEGRHDLPQPWRQIGAAQT